MPEAAPRAFVDTNVWISALINAAGAPARMLDAVLEERFVLVVSQALFDEIREVLARPRVRQRCRFSDDDLSAIFALLRDRAIEVSPAGELQMCRDPDDDILLETAILGGAQYAISRDDDLKRDLDLTERLREHGVEVLSVAQFLRVLATRAP